MYNRNCIHIIRKIPLERPKYPQTVDKTTGKTAEQELLEFCIEPRTAHEIKDFLSLETINQTNWRFLRPLVKQGKLNFTTPDDPDKVYQMYLTAGVERTSEIEELIQRKSKRKGNIELEQKVLEFCKEPKTLKEIAIHLNMNFSVLAKKRAVTPLLNEGKLKLRYPHDPMYQWQQYVIAESEIPQLTEENIIEFCKVPRYKHEIKKHFDMCGRLGIRFLDPMIESGKLFYNECVKYGKVLKQIKLTSVMPLIQYPVTPIRYRTPLELDKNHKTVNKETGLTLGQELVDFCEEPRSILEIQKFLGLRTKRMVNERFTKPLMNQGRIKFIYPESPKSNLQRYLKADVEFTPEMQIVLVQERKAEEDIVLEQKTLEFCKEPRTMGEIKDYLGLSYYEAVNKRVVRPLLAQGKIRLLYPHNPKYAYQKYVIMEADTNLAFSDESIIKYCETPRHKEDIMEYFQVGQHLCYRVVNSLVEMERLKYTKATRIGNKITKRQLIKNG